MEGIKYTQVFSLIFLALSLNVYSQDSHEADKLSILKATDEYICLEDTFQIMEDSLKATGALLIDSLQIRYREIHRVIGCASPSFAKHLEQEWQSLENYVLNLDTFILEVLPKKRNEFLQQLKEELDLTIASFWKQAESRGFLDKNSPASNDHKMYISELIIRKSNLAFSSSNAIKNWNQKLMAFKESIDYQKLANFQYNFEIQD